METRPNLKPDLRDLPAQAVQDLVVSLGQKPFRARQILQWLYPHGARSIAGMTTLSKAFRERLAGVCRLDDLAPSQVETAADGTQKLLYTLADGRRVEGVLIPEEDHSTLCVSTQVGCRQGCRFCRTARLGFQRNLSPGEITGQVLAARRLTAPEQPLTNLVFMGMGEPLDNLENLLIALEHILGDHGLKMSQRKVTVSTVGLLDRLAILGHATPAALAVSLTAADDELRSRLMPVNRRFPLARLREALNVYPLKPTRRITLEYVLLGGVNDQPEHARQLAAWAKGLRCKINLIPFNPHDGAEFLPPSPGDLESFQQILIDGHLTAIIRQPRGADIAAACGQLAARAQAAEEGQPTS
ncbi:MAG: 23S rRNA (adenine(2503)-C(2))-methyltransferase RlmN [Deltaproteobacteria bacterium]|nr:23S rRNA (adenine(2503)-C(2))-methyltransferase RlmN [Deltaproteobacteria bacterium]